MFDINTSKQYKNTRKLILKEKNKIKVKFTLDVVTS
jgi:hypothetical protein